ncbi:hypothetical protein CEXT_96951 [Caerostris extrusa]|uniref:Uncharacterized protein n=1 Tax=Caerostris extrusa TaxID=172846 RepID=A0AAV4NRT2_CAEEX|nr:hypothetical protein CEXT_96951 [Caerostris extrusa]
MVVIVRQGAFKVFLSIRVLENLDLKMMLQGIVFTVIEIFTDNLHEQIVYRKSFNLFGPKSDNETGVNTPDKRVWPIFSFQFNESNLVYQTIPEVEEPCPFLQKLLFYLSALSLKWTIVLFADFARSSSVRVCLFFMMAEAIVHNEP